MAANAEKVSELFSELVMSSKKSTEKCQYVALSSKEQYASSEEVKISAEALNDIAPNLQTTINKFKL